MIKLGDVVNVIPLSPCEGRVISIWETHEGMKYEIRYFFNGKPEQVYLYPDEIEKNERKRTSRQH
jgi:hypothetical protein